MSAYPRKIAACDGCEMIECSPDCEIYADQKAEEKIEMMMEEKWELSENQQKK
jgi:hypothetical protein